MFSEIPCQSLWKYWKSLFWVTMLNALFTLTKYFMKMFSMFSFNNQMPVNRTSVDSSKRYNNCNCRAVLLEQESSNYIHRLCNDWFVFVFQFIWIQWWKHDGSLQPGYLLRSNASADPTRPWSGFVSSQHQRNHQNNHHQPWGNISQRWWRGLWEMYPRNKVSIITKSYSPVKGRSVRYVS